MGTATVTVTGRDRDGIRDRDRIRDDCLARGSWHRDHLGGNSPLEPSGWCGGLGLRSPLGGRRRGNSCLALGGWRGGHLGLKSQLGGGGWRNNSANGGWREGWRGGWRGGQLRLRNHLGGNGFTTAVHQVVCGGCMGARNDTEKATQRPKKVNLQLICPQTITSYLPEPSYDQGHARG